MNRDQNGGLIALVIDDNEVNSLILSKTLNMFKINTDQAYSGKFALKLFRKKEYDFIFVDHVMPEMDGIQVTKAIRRLEKEGRRALIFVLTSDLPEEIRRQYMEAGADDIFEKPMTLSKVDGVLKKWYLKPVPELKHSIYKQVPMHHTDTNQLRILLEGIHDINFDMGMKYALGDPFHFVHILKVSLRDIENFLNLIEDMPKTGDYSRVKTGLHNLKSIFSNIGASGLLEEMKLLDDILGRCNTNPVLTRLCTLSEHIRDIKDRLTDAIIKYEAMRALPNREGKTKVSMSKAEYEQCIGKAIYYIRSIEYDSIINELNKLMKASPEYREELATALEEIAEFNYDTALERLMRIQQKMKEE